VKSRAFPEQRAAIRLGFALKQVRYRRHILGPSKKSGRIERIQTRRRRSSHPRTTVKTEAVPFWTLQPTVAGWPVPRRLGNREGSYADW
jgi:hypothetical protein